MAGLIVQHLAGFKFQDFKVQIFLPDSTSRMFPSTDLFFNAASGFLIQAMHPAPLLGLKRLWTI